MKKRNKKAAHDKKQPKTLKIRPDNTNNVYVPVGLLVDVLFATNNFSIRMKYALKTDMGRLKVYLNSHLGINLNYIELDKSINN